MDTGTYSAASALLAALRTQEVTAHNLANVNTPGFKRRLAALQPFQEHLAAAQGEPTGTTPEGVTIDFARGPIDHTGNPLDLALEGEGFFVLRGPQGQLYSRQGSFTLDGSGRIVDSVGRPLLGEGGGELTVPTDTTAIRVDQEGRVFADDTEVGKVWVVDVAKPRAFVPAAYTAFALPPDGPAPHTVERACVMQGALEGSNTNPIDELVSMITTLRSFETAQRSLASLADTTDMLTRAAQNTGS